MFHVPHNGEIGCGQFGFSKKARTRLLLKTVNHYFSQRSLKFDPVRYRVSPAWTNYHFPRFAFQLARDRRLRVMQYSLTFPDEDLSVGAVVQDEAVVADQQLLAKRALLRHFGRRHRTRRIRHLLGK